jgi:hypothetical protein
LLGFLIRTESPVNPLYAFGAEQGYA